MFSSGMNHSLEPLFSATQGAWISREVQIANAQKVEAHRESRPPASPPRQHSILPSLGKADPPARPPGQAGNLPLPFSRLPRN